MIRGNKGKVKFPSLKFKLFVILSNADRFRKGNLLPEA
jgi:hypothetical protein